MGQRSQIYVRFRAPSTKASGELFDKDVLLALYFGWNYGERMVSRASSILEYLKDNTTRSLGISPKKLQRFAEVNWDMKDILPSVNLAEEFDALEAPEWDKNDYIFNHDNNDGCLFVDAFDLENIKVAFTDNHKFAFGVEDYLNWDINNPWRESQYVDKETIKYTERTIRFIEENSTYMSQAEVDEFIHHSYSYSKR